MERFSVTFFLEHELERVSIGLDLLDLTEMAHETLV